MASGGKRPYSKSASTEPRINRTWARASSGTLSDKEDNISLSNEHRPNNWDFSDWKPTRNATTDKTKRQKKGNPEREREQSLSYDSPPSQRRQHTPSSYPRARITPNTPRSERLALEKLKQELIFRDFDEASNEGEKNNERNVLPRQAKRENFERQEASNSEGASVSFGRSREGGPDHIVSRLMQIREYIKQANAMKDALYKSGNTQDLRKSLKLDTVINSLREQENQILDNLKESWQANQDELDKIRKLAASLQEQEMAYVALLQQYMTLKESNGTEDRVNGLLNTDSVDDASSVDLDVRSQVSETTENSPRPNSRPRIEDKLGLSDDDDEDDEADGMPDNTEETLVEDVSADNNINDLAWEERADLDEVRKNELRALRQQQELLKKLIEQQEQMKALKSKQAALLSLQKDAERRLLEVHNREEEVAQIPVQASDDGGGAMGTVPNSNLPQELLEIRQHLNYLRNELKEQTPYVQEGRKNNHEREAEATSARLEDNRRQLEDKLLDLQSKKSRMDSLLHELQDLRSQRFHTQNMLNNTGAEENDEVASPAHSNSASMIAEGRAALDGAENTLSNAQGILDVMDAQEKLSKLREVKERLNQLRSLVQYYQSAGAGSDMDEKAAFMAQLEATDMTGARQNDIDRPAVSRQPPQQEASVKSDEDNQSEVSNLSQTESNLSNPGSWGNDPEIIEKIRQLKAAKEKLKQLHDIVNQVQGGSQLVQNLPPELSSLGVEEEQEYEVAPSEDRNLSEGELPLSQEEKNSFYERKMQEQLRELNMLKEERMHLMAVQQELQSLQGRFSSNVPTSKEEEPKMGTVEVAAEDNDDEEENKQIERPTIRVAGPTVKFSSNDEVYGKMRKQRMLREELRQKKKELEAIMKKDSGHKKHYSKNQDNQSDTVSFSTEVYGAMSADATMATWGGSTVDNLESITEDNDGNDNEEEDDAYPSDGIIQVEEEEEEADSDTNTYTIENDVRQRRQRGADNVPSQRNKDRKERTFPRSSSQKGGARPKQNAWSKYQKKGKKPKQEDILDGVDPDDTRKPDYENLQQQLQRTAAMCQNLLEQTSGGLMQVLTNTTPSLALNPYNNSNMLYQQMQQQQLLLNMSQQQISMQQMEIQKLQQQMQNLQAEQDVLSSLPAPEDFRLRSLQSLNSAGNILSPKLASLPGRPESFNVQPQFPTSFYRSNEALSSQMIQDGTTEREGRSRGIPNVHQLELEGRLLTTRNRLGNRRTVSSDLDLNYSEEQSGMSTDNSPQLNLFQRYKKKSSGIGMGQNDTKETDESGREGGRNKTRKPKQRGQQSNRSGDRQGAGLGSSGYRDSVSITSSLAGRPVTTLEQNSNQQPVNEEEDGDLSLFEILRESIYSEVAALISKNEDRPHFLIELFQDLQLLSTDYLRQRALYSIKDVVSNFISEGNSLPRQNIPAWMENMASTSELTPSESLVSEDDESKNNQATSQRRRIFQDSRSGSIQNRQYDFVEPVEGSSMSSPSTSLMENPFARDSLGETAINLDKALKKIREENAKIKKTKNAKMTYDYAENARAARHQMSDAASSSAMDRDSVSSVSSLSYSRIDTGELNKQIKTIMQEVVPVIKEHIDSVCSSQLLAYIKRVVLSLIRSMDSEQTPSFFHSHLQAQLNAALHDALSKFEGRKLRVCGEDLLVEMSEVLFNELAFSRLMQGIGEPSQMSQQNISTSIQTQCNLDEDDQTEESDTTESTPSTTGRYDPESRADTDVIPTNEGNTSLKLIANEEEDLGKSRDDEFASEMQIQDDKDDEAADASAVHIELAVSETKPFTRIGSDEDDEDASESQSADDPSETAVSRDAMMERSLSADENDDIPLDTNMMNGEDADQGSTSHSDHTTPRDDKQPHSVNGQNEDDELMPDDLPTSFNVKDLDKKMKEEEQANKASLVTPASKEEELAGSSQSLKEPNV